MTIAANNPRVPVSNRGQHPSEPNRFPVIVYWIGALFCAPFLMGENSLLACSIVVIGVLITSLVWREGEAQFPLFVCLYQLLQVFAPVVQAEILDVPVRTLFGGVEFEKATWLSLAGVLAFSAGMSVPLRRWAPVNQQNNSQVHRALVRLSIQKLLFVWALLVVLEQVLTGVISIPSIGTAWRPIGFLRYAAALLIFQNVFIRKKGWGVLILILGVETLSGFLSYFSGFKTVYFLLLVAAATYLHRDRRLWLPSAIALAGMLGLAFFWQSMKGEYRQFLNQGEGQQVVNVSLEERLQYLGSSASDLSGEKVSEVLESSLSRLGYIKFFGYSIIQVPENIEHTGGRLWKEAITNIIQPRILFPNKQVFNDSDRTNEFTGLIVADASKGTSIGIGYVGESYIDFGVPLMFVPIVFFGMAVGFGYAHFVRITKPRVFGIGIGTSLLLSSILFLESSNAKMLGGFVSSFLVYLVFVEVQKRFFPAWFGLIARDRHTLRKRPERWQGKNIVSRTPPGSNAR